MFLETRMFESGRWSEISKEALLVCQKRCENKIKHVSTRSTRCNLSWTERGTCRKEMRLGTCGKRKRKLLIEGSSKKKHGTKKKQFGNTFGKSPRWSIKKMSHKVLSRIVTSAGRRTRRRLGPVPSLKGHKKLLGVMEMVAGCELMRSAFSKESDQKGTIKVNTRHWSLARKGVHSWC